MKDYLNGEFSDVAQVTFGPFEAPIYKVDDRYRRRFVIKCKLNNKTKKFFETVMRKFGTEFNGPRKPQLSVDLNPTNL